MGLVFSARGDRGVTRVGYQHAIKVRNWHLTRENLILSDRSSRVYAVVDSIDTYWSTQRQTSMGLWMGQSWWVWEDVTSPDPATIRPGSRVEFRLEGHPVAVTWF